VNLENLFSLSGKTAVVAGASRGIGLAVAKAFAIHGARTVLASRSVSALEKQVRALRQAGRQAEVFELDVTRPETFAALEESYPEIDILCGVAGTNIRKPFERYTGEETRHIMETNLHGLAELTRSVGVRMVNRRKGGKIIQIGSLMSLLGLPYVSVYAMTKSALAGLTRVLAAEWGPHGIQVNCIAPGFILTDLNRKMWAPQPMHDWLEGVQAIPRLGRPEDIAGLAVYLASPASDYVTGQVIAVDGGYTTTARWPLEV